MAKLTLRDYQRILRVIKDYPAILLVLALLGGVFYSYEIFYAREKASVLGVPDAKGFSLNRFVRVFRNDGFMVGYSEYRANPLWVVYKLQEPDPNAPKLPRPSKFESDWRSIRGVNHDDYTGSGYDRGHMAPNYAISTLYGKDAQLQTFLMTNITPQKPKLNQQLWQRLEELEVSFFTTIFKEVWVITGTIFDDNIEYLKSSRVEIPDSFYKILVVFDENKKPHTLAFLMPQNVYGNEPLDRYLTTIDEIERLSGFDFLHKLDDSLENAIEAEIDALNWRLKEVANKKSRY